MNHIHDPKILKYSKGKRPWNYVSEGVWVGGRFELPNLSTGYHGLVMEWLNHSVSQLKNPKLLLVSEGNKVKSHFKAIYKNCEILTTDLHWDLQTEPDITADICKLGSLPVNEFDIIVNHSVLEHVYAPFVAMQNMVNSLKKGGYLITGTHPPAFRYHQFPRDYIRFVIDWWYDLPQFIKGIELQEFFQVQQHYVFSCYKKV